MDNASYKFLKYLDIKVNGKEKDFTSYINDLYNIYTKSLNRFNHSFIISKNQFYKIFYTIFDVLNLRNIDLDVIKNQCEMYLYNVIADSICGEINLKWFIDKMWYLSIGIEGNINAFRDTIPFIQDKLLKELEIDDKLTEKLNRKIYTMMLIK